MHSPSTSSKRNKSGPARAAPPAVNESKRRALALAVSASVGTVMAGFADDAQAARGGIKVNNVAAGSAKFDQRGSHTTITAADRTVINYRSFNVAVSESVRFNLPSARARVLNRIQSATPSRIDGSISSNGIVYFANPAGVIFGPGAVVNAAGVYAAAAQISNTDFMNGRNRFTNASGTVANQGSIQADAVALIGRRVENSGVVVGKNDVMMVSGNDVLIGPRFGGVLVQAGTVADSQAAAAPAPVGLGAGDIYSLAVIHTGHIAARSVTLQAPKAGSVSVSGTIDASTSRRGATGGTVTVTAGKIALEGAKVDASGPAGGGKVRIGGEFRGKGKTPTAQSTAVSADSTIKANATARGKGGEVVVWGDERTEFRGSIEAKGGPRGGDGGSAEVSGKALLFDGAADLTAAGGATGELLLDPVRFDIVDGSLEQTDDHIGEVDLEILARTADVNITAGEIVLHDLSDNLLEVGHKFLLTSTDTGGITFIDPLDEVRTTGGEIRLEAQGTGGLSLGKLTSAGGPITLIAGGAVTLRGAVIADALSGSGLDHGPVSITAGAGATAEVPGADVNLHANVSGASITIAAGGGVFQPEASARLTANTTSVSAHGSIGQLAGDPIRVNGATPAGTTLQLTGLGDGDLVAHADGALSLDATSQGVGNIDVTAGNVSAGQLAIGQVTTGGDISLTNNRGTVVNRSDASTIRSPGRTVVTAMTLDGGVGDIGTAASPLRVDSNATGAIVTLGASNALHTYIVPTGEVTIAAPGFGSNARLLRGDVTYDLAYTTDLTLRTTGALTNPSDLVLQVPGHLRMIAGGGVGTAANAIRSTALRLSGSADTDGFYYNGMIGGLDTNLNVGPVSTASGNIDIRTDTPGISLTLSGNITAGEAGVARDVSISTTGDITRDNVRPAVVSGEDVTLRSTGGRIGGPDPIQTRADTLRLSAAGSIAVDDIIAPSDPARHSPSLTVLSAETTDADVTITARRTIHVADVRRNHTGYNPSAAVTIVSSEGSLDVDKIDAQDSKVSLTAADAIRGLAGATPADPHVYAQALVMRAGTGVGGSGAPSAPLLTRVQQLAAYTAAGDLTVHNTGPLSIADLLPGGAPDPVRGLSSAGGRVELHNADGDVNINARVSADRDVDITLTTAGMTLTNRADVSGNGAGFARGAVVLTADKMDLGIAPDASVLANDSFITIQPYSGGRAVTFGFDPAETTLALSNDELNTLRGSRLVVRSGGDITFAESINLLPANVAQLTLFAPVGGVRQTFAGTAYTGTSLAVLAGGSVGPLTTRVANLAVEVTGPASSISIDNQRSLAIATLAGVPDTAASTDVSGVHATGSGTVTLRATPADADLVMDPGTAVTSDLGDVTMIAGHDVRLRRVQTNRGSVVLSAETGSIVDENGTGGINVYVVTPNPTSSTDLVATAAGGIELDTHVSTVRASSTSRGDVTLRQKLNLGDEVSRLTLQRASTNQGNIVVDANGDVAAESVSARGGNVSITAARFAAADGSIRVREIEALPFGAVSQPAVSLTADGAVMDSNGAGPVNITAHTLTARSGASGATGPAGIELDTLVSKVTATVLRDGNIVLRQTSTGSAPALELFDVTTTSGNIDVSWSAAVNSDAPRAALTATDVHAGNGGTVSLTTRLLDPVLLAGDLAVGSISGSTVTLTSGAGITDANTAGAVNVVAADLVATAASLPGPTPPPFSADINLDTQVSRVVADHLATGNIVLRQTTGSPTPQLDLRSLTTRDGSISVTWKRHATSASPAPELIATNVHARGGDVSLTTESGGDMRVHAVTANPFDASGRTVNLTAAGSITDGNDAAGADPDARNVNVHAQSLNARAGGVIDLDTNVSRVDAVSAAGDIRLRQTVGTAVPLDLRNVEAQDGNIDVRSRGETTATNVSVTGGDATIIVTGNPARADLIVHHIEVASTAGPAGSTIGGTANLLVWNGSIFDGNGQTLAGGPDVLNVRADSLVAEVGRAPSLTNYSIDLDTSVSTVNATDFGVGNITLRQTGASVPTLRLASVVTHNGTIAVTADNTTTASEVHARAGDVGLSVRSGNLRVDSITAQPDGLGQRQVNLVVAGAITDLNGADINVVAGSLTAAVGGASPGPNSNASSIDLDTDVFNITAANYGDGNIQLRQLTTSAVGGVRPLSLDSVTTANGSIDVRAASTITARSVHAVDGGNPANDADIRIQSTAGDIEVRSITASTDSHPDNTVTLIATGKIYPGGAPDPQVAGGTLDASAGTGIDLGTSVRVVRGTTTTGNITLRQTGKEVTLEQLHAKGGPSPDSGNISVIADMQMTAVDVIGRTSIVLTTVHGDIVGGSSENPTASISAPLVTLDARDGDISDGNTRSNHNVRGDLVDSGMDGELNATATGGIDLDTRVGRITARSTGSGDIELRQRDIAVELTSVLTNDGSIIASSEQDMTVIEAITGQVPGNVRGTVTLSTSEDTADIITEFVSGRAVTMTSDGGSIVDRNGPPTPTNPAINVRADELLTATAAQNIELDTVVTTIDADAEAGNVTLRQTERDVTLRDIDAGQTADVRGTHDLHTGTLDANEVFLNAGESITDANAVGVANVSSQFMTALAFGGIELDIVVSEVRRAVAQTADVLLRQTGIPVTLTEVRAVAGNVNVSSVENMTAVFVYAGTDVTLTTSEGNIIAHSIQGDVATLDSADAITDGNGTGTLNVLADTLLAWAENGIELDTNVSVVDADTTDLDVVLRQSGRDILLRQVHAGRHVNVTATDLITVDTIIAGDVVTLDGGRDIADGNGPVMNVTGERLEATARGFINLDTRVGEINARATAAGDITLRQDGRPVVLELVQTVAGTIDVDASHQTTATDVHAGGGDVLIAVRSGSLLVDSISARPDGPGERGVFLTVAGSITDLNGDGVVNVAAGSLVANVGGAGPGPNSGAASINLDTEVHNVTAHDFGDGNITLRQTTQSPGRPVRPLSLDSVTTANGSIDVLAGATVTAVHVVADDGNAAANDANVTIRTTAGDILAGFIAATDDQVLARTVTLDAAGAIRPIAGAAAPQIRAGTLAATAGSGIDLDTSVKLVTATTATGDITLRQTGKQITLEQLWAKAGSITVTADAQMTAIDVIAKTSVALTTTGGDIVAGSTSNATAAISAALVTLDAAGAIRDGNGNTNHNVRGDLVDSGVAGVLSATARGGVELDTRVGFITAQSLTSGDVLLRQRAIPVELTLVSTRDGLIHASSEKTMTAVMVVTGRVPGQVRGTVNLHTTHDGADIRTHSVSGRAVTMTSDGGSITDANSGLVNVRADELLTATADQDIELDTVVTTIVADGIHGDVTFRQSERHVTLEDVHGGGKVLVTATDAMDAKKVVAEGESATLITTGGNINTGTVTADGDLVALDAAASITDLNGQGVNNITAQVMTALANGGIDLDTIVSEVKQGIARGDDVVLRQTGIPVTLTEIKALAGNVVISSVKTMTAIDVFAGTNATLSTSQGDIVAHRIQGDLVTLASADKISDGNGSGTINLIADTLVATAENGIELDTNVLTIDADTNSADVVLRQTSRDVLLRQVHAGSDVNVRATDLITVDTITAGDIVTLDGGDDIADGNGGDMNVTAERLEATADGLINLDTRVGVINAQATAPGGITLRQDGRAVTLERVQTVNGTIDVDSSHAITATDVRADGGDALLTARSGAINVDWVSGGTVELDAAASITDLNGGDRNVTGLLVARAGGGIDLDTRSNTINALARGGDITLREEQDTHLQNIDASGAINVSSDAGSLAVGRVAADRTVTLTATSGGADITAAGAASLVTGTTLTASADDTIDLHTGVNELALTAGAGGARVLEDDSVTVSLLDVSGNIHLTAASGVMTVTQALVSNPGSSQVYVGTISLDPVGAGGSTFESGDVMFENAVDPARAGLDLTILATRTATLGDSVGGATPFASFTAGNSSTPGGVLLVNHDIHTVGGIAFNVPTTVDSVRHGDADITSDSGRIDFAGPASLAGPKIHLTAQGDVLFRSTADTNGSNLRIVSNAGTIAFAGRADLRGSDLGINAPGSITFAGPTTLTGAGGTRSSGVRVSSSGSVINFLGTAALDADDLHVNAHHDIAFVGGASINGAGVEVRSTEGAVAFTGSAEVRGSGASVTAGTDITFGGDATLDGSPVRLVAGGKVEFGGNATLRAPVLTTDQPDIHITSAHGGILFNNGTTFRGGNVSIDAAGDGNIRFHGLVSAAENTAVVRITGVQTANGEIGNVFFDEAVNGAGALTLHVTGNNITVHNITAHEVRLKANPGLKLKKARNNTPLVDDRGFEDVLIPDGIIRLGSEGEQGDIRIVADVIVLGDRRVNESGLEDIPGVATILTLSERDVYFLATDRFEMGNGEKMTVLGTVVIADEGRDYALSNGVVRVSLGATNNVVLGDINALSRIYVFGDAIDTVSRFKKPLALRTPVPRQQVQPDFDPVKVASDNGVDFFANDGIVFSQPPNRTTFRGTSGGSDSKTFASFGVGPAGTVNLGGTAFLFRRSPKRYDSGQFVARFQFQDGIGPDARTLDATASGPLSGDWHQMSIIDETTDPVPSEEDSISVALKRQLAEIGIYVRSMKEVELVRRVFGRGIYEELPEKWVDDPATYKLVAARIPRAAAAGLIEACQSVFPKIDQDGLTFEKQVEAFNDQLSKAMEAYPVKEGELNVDIFRAWIDGQPDTEFKLLKTKLARMDTAIRRLNQLGLTSPQWAAVRDVWSDQLSDSTLRDVLERMTLAAAHRDARARMH